MNLADKVLNTLITRFVTKDEWHLLVMGVADGLSFSNNGKYIRKALSNPQVNVEGIEHEKSWYYKAPYAAAEVGKVAAIVYFTGETGNFLP